VVQLLQTFKNNWLLIFVLCLLLLLSGCQQKDIVITASIPKEVAISKNIIINQSNEVKTKGVEAILAPIVSGVSDSYFKNRYSVKKHCIEYKIVVYKDSKYDYLVIDCLDGTLIIEKKEKKNE